MPAQTPLLLIDNIFDNVALYQAALVDASSEVAGREAFRVASYRRDRQAWQPTSDHNPNGGWVRVDLGAGVTRGVDFLFIDRGHNLWGKTVTLEAGDDGAAWGTSQAFTVPAIGTVGGDPTWPSIAVTEEGALYSLKATTWATKRWFRFRVNYVAAFIPIVTGLIAGLKSQLLGYSNVFDEDAGERTESQETSQAGYRGSAVTYSWRVAEIGLAYIGSAEYDASMREIRRLLFQLNQAFVLFMDYGGYPARGWMFQYDGRSWGMSKTKVYRNTRWRFREVGATLV
jgi:hypothetical protein